MSKGLKIRLSIYVSVLLASFALSIWSLRPVEYEAKASVKVLQQMSVAGLLTEWIVYDPSDSISSQVAMITGFPVLRQVALRRGDIDESTSREDVDRVIRQYQSRVSAQNLGQTNIIEITARDKSPRMAVDLVDAVIEVYVGENLNEKRKQYRTAQRFIEGQLIEIEQKLKVKERLATDKRPTEPFQRKIVDLELEMSALLSRYTERHPQIRQIEEEIGNLERQLKMLTREDTLHAQIAREVEVDRKIYAMLKAKLEEARISEAQKVPDVSVVNPAILPQSMPAHERIRMMLARW